MNAEWIDLGPVPERVWRLVGWEGAAWGSLLPGLQFLVRWRSWNDGYGVEFEVYRCWGAPQDTFWDGELRSPEPDFENADLFLEGRVKWDGCVSLDARGCVGDWHFCDRESVAALGGLFPFLYDLGRRCPRWEGD